MAVCVYMQLNIDECECGCVIDQLLEKSFFLYNFEEKKEIIENGRPTPILNNFKKESKKVVRHFKFSWYSENFWLCGCKKIDCIVGRVFCFLQKKMGGPAAESTI
jgi:hypothetical protein